MRRFVIFILVLSIFTGSNAQTARSSGPVISGKITDINGVTLTGANVSVENYGLGNITDKNGTFRLQLTKPGNYTIRFSFIGYEPLIREFKIDRDTTVTISLKTASFITEDVFVSATRANENTPLAYSTVSKESIKKVNIAQDIPYILNYTPSLVVSSDAGTGVGYTNINIRGTDVGRINVTIDGVPVNDAESHGVWWVDLPDMASSADNIQVQRGVGTSTNGAGAFGATINFQTAPGSKEAYGELNSSYGSFNTSKNTISFGTGLLGNKFAIDGRLSKIYSDGYIDRAYSDLKSFYVSGTLFGKSSILKLIIFSGIEHTYQAWSGVPKDSLATHRTYNPYSYSNETDNYWQDNYQLHYSNALSSSLSFDAALHYTYGRGYYENLYADEKFSKFNLPDAVINNDTLSKTDFVAQKWLRNHFYGMIYSLSLKKEKFSAVAGGSWNQYLGDHFGDVTWARIVNFDGQVYRWYSGTGNKKDLNTYLKMNYLPVKGLILYADLQLRNIDYSIAGIDDNLKDVTQAHRYNFFNPKAGITYDPDQKQKVYASVGVSQREPDRSNFIDADPGRTPVPEKLYDYEAGYQYQTNLLTLKANIYYMNYRDQLILTGKINNVGSAIMVNVPQSYRLGVELEAGVRPITRLSWYGNITLSRNKIKQFTDYTDDWDTGLQVETQLNNSNISFSPSVIAGSILDYTPVSNLHLSFNSKFVGKQYIDNTASSGRQLNSYNVHNLSFLYTVDNKLFKELSLQFVINNIFNSLYETNAWVYKYYEGGKPGEMNGYFPQAGRNYMFRLGIKF